MRNTTLNPRVSVIVPVWNAERYIASTLRSIRDQDFSDFEVLVIDDCSTDRSSEIIADFVSADSRFKYHKSETNFGGPAGPRNIGLDAARGEFISFCDADDIWVEHKLSVQIEAMRATGADMICSKVCDFRDEDSLPVYSKPEPLPTVKEIRRSNLLIKNWIALSSVIVRKNVIDEAGRFNTSRAFVAVEDYDMWLRISRNGGRLLRIATTLVHYRKLPTSISSDKIMMIRKALNVIALDYEARGMRFLFAVLKPVHWALYVTSSAWMRAVRREL